MVAAGQEMGRGKKFREKSGNFIFRKSQGKLK